MISIIDLYISIIDLYFLDNRTADGTSNTLPTLTITVVSKEPIGIYEYGGLSNRVVQKEAPCVCCVPYPPQVCEGCFFRLLLTGHVVMLMSSVPPTRQNSSFTCNFPQFCHVCLFTNANEISLQVIMRSLMVWRLLLHSNWPCGYANETCAYGKNAGQFQSTNAHDPF